jgi:hypothetical protein
MKTMMMRLVGLFDGTSDQLRPVARPADDTDGAEGEPADGDTEGADGAGDEADDTEEEGADDPTEGEGGEDTDGDADGEEAEGDADDGEPQDGEGAEGEGEGESAEGDDADDGDDADGEGAGEEGGNKAGGNAEDEGPGMELEDFEGDTGLLDPLEALTQGFDKEAEDVRTDEQIWRPWDTGCDRVVTPEIADHQRDSFKRKTRKADKELLTTVAALRSYFRNKFLSSRQPEVRHGLRRGSHLSDRRLVASFIEMKGGKTPSRPWARIKKQPAESLAIAVVGDMSGSMDGGRGDRKLYKMAAKGMYAVASAFCDLGSPILCCGVRDNWEYAANPYGARALVKEGDFHRTSGVDYIIFKDWQEKTKDVADRFWKYSATGGTPLSDGVQFALEQINTREEKHRLILVVTDGVPNSPKVVQRQIRLAEEAGIKVVGVGIGWGCREIGGLFPDHVVVENVEDLPRALVDKVESLVFPPTGGGRAQLDGTTGHARRGY